MIEVRLDRGVRGAGAAWVRRIVEKTLKYERSGTDRVGVLLTHDRAIRRLNKKFLKHDYATDVISFGFGDRENLGDLVVSVDTARRVSKQLRIGFREELARYLVHGTLHLLGYDDRKKKDHDRMHRRQEALLKRIL